MFCRLICVRARTQTTTPYSTLLRPAARLLPFYSDYRIWGLCTRSGFCTRSGAYTLSLADFSVSSLDLRPGPNPNHNASYSTTLRPAARLLPLYSDHRLRGLYTGLLSISLSLLYRHLLIYSLYLDLSLRLPWTGLACTFVA